MDIIELVENCNLVKTAYEENKECWGNKDWVPFKYVWIDGKFTRCYDGWYVVHNSKRIKKILTPYQMERINQTEIF